jgi:hypothetical protein
MMRAFDGVRVGASLPASGFAKAFNRWQDAQDSDDSVEAYLAVSESLEWAHALDELIARTWRPRGAVSESPWWRWREDPALGGGPYLADAMQGLCYVRNRVHHHLADALESVADPTSPGRFAFIWRDADELPTGRAARETGRRQAYTRALAGSPVGMALGMMSETFVFIGVLLDAPRARSAAPIAAVDSS